MTNLKTLISNIPDYAKDIKVNLENLLSEQNQALTQKQIFGAALASAYATKEKSLIENLENESTLHLSDQELKAVKIATTLMAMNNIYYRFTHIIADKEYEKMSSGLKMKGIIEHGIEKVDFEIFTLAVSIINGCAGCIDAHANQMLKHGMTKTQIQMVAKIAATINAAAQILTIEEISE